MTLEQLDQYGKLKTRWYTIKKKIEDRRLDPVDRVVDIVEGSNKFYPYQRVHFGVAGLDPDQLGKKTMQIRGWEREFEAIETEVAEIEAYVSSVSDPIVKTALELYYLCGETWAQVSTDIYGSANQQDALRISVKRYVDANP